MTQKHQIPHPDSHKLPDGSHDQGKISATLRVLADQVDAGHYKGHGLSLTPLDGKFSHFGAVVENVDPDNAGEPHPALA
jgi:hypothetical protein